jgi:hypothetical protein
MICHAKRIAENRRIDEMERKVKPLVIMIIVCFVMLSVQALADIYASHKYQSLIDSQSQLIRAMNGEIVDIGDSILSCRIDKFDLVNGIK